MSFRSGTAAEEPAFLLVLRVPHIFAFFAKGWDAADSRAHVLPPP
jgi:hypothetical protein